MATPPPPPPATPPPPPVTPPLPPVAAATGNNRALMIILIILGAIVLIIGGCAVACGLLIKKGADKAKEYSAEAEKNPQLAALSLAASLHPQIEVVSKDVNAGIITLRNKKTGETVRLNVSNLSNEDSQKAFDRFARGLQPDTTAAKTETISSEEKSESTPPPPSTEHPVSSAQASAVKASLRKFPADFPIYNGGGATTEAANSTSVGPASTYQQVFSTSDVPDDVVLFYETKLTPAGYTQVASESASNNDGPTANATFQRADGNATFSVQAEVRNGKTHVETHYLLLKAK